MTQPKPSKWALEKASLYSLSDKNIKRLALDFDAIAREVRAENHFTAAIDERLKAAEKLKRELEKAEGQLDIILRECQGDDDASLANDYGGTGWEKEVPVAIVRWHRNRWKKSNEAAENLGNCRCICGRRYKPTLRPYNRRRKGNE